MSIQIEVWGDYACFSRPEMKTERVSYDVMTPSAARGLIESIYWHPGLRYCIDRIHVLKPIRFTKPPLSRADALWAWFSNCRKKTSILIPVLKCCHALLL